MRSTCVLLFALFAAFLFSPGRAAAQGITGSYDGRYQCGDWNTLNLQVRDLGVGRISAVFTFAVPPRLGGGHGSYSMMGTYDERTGRFQLTPQQWMRRPQGYNMVGLDGVFDRDSRGLRG
jgi:hypothetical protein